MKRAAYDQSTPPGPVDIGKAKVQCSRESGSPENSCSSPDDFLQSLPQHTALLAEAAGYTATLREGLSQLWNSSTFSDCVLEVGSEEIPAHRLVLSTWSPVFKTLLSSRWQPCRSSAPPSPLGSCQPQQQRIRVELTENTNPGHFCEALRFMYCGSCTLQPSNVLPLLRLSNYYEILSLKELCGRFLFNLLVERNLQLLHVLSERYACTSLRQMLTLHVAHHFEELMESGALLGLCADVWEEALQTEDLAVADECMVLGALAEYARSMPTKLQQDRIMDKLLPCVRLPLLGVPALTQKIEKDNWLMSLPCTKDLLYHAFRHLVLSSSSSDVEEDTHQDTPALLCVPPADDVHRGGSQASTGSPSPSAPGEGPSHAGSENTRMKKLLRLQGRRRKPTVAFDAAMAVGFHLTKGRTCATAELPLAEHCQGPPHSASSAAFRAAGGMGAGRSVGTSLGGHGAVGAGTSGHGRLVPLFRVNHVNELRIFRPDSMPRSATWVAPKWSGSLCQCRNPAPVRPMVPWFLG